MKKIVFSIIAIIAIVVVSSCVDEDDFNLNRLSETTINPTFGANFLDMDFYLKDFIDLDSIADSTQGIALTYQNEAEGNFWQFEVTKDMELGVGDITDFNSMLPVDPVNLDLATVTIPDLSGLSGTYTVADEDFSVPVPPLEPVEEHRRIDKVILSAGLMNVNVNSALPCQARLIVTSNDIKDSNGNNLNKTITIGANNNLDDDLDLTKYSVELSRQANSGDTSHISLHYKIVLDLNSSVQAGNYNINISFGFNNCDIYLAYGKVGNAVIPLSDSLYLDYLSNSDLANSIRPNNINIKAITMDMLVYSNIGLKTDIDISNVYTLTSALRRTYLFPNQIKHINRSITPQEESVTHLTLDPNTEAIEVLPDKFVYNLKFHLYDTAETYPSFVFPTKSYIRMHTITKIPLKLKINDLTTTQEISALDFITNGGNDDVADHLLSATVNMIVTNDFPASIKIDLLYVNTNGDTVSLLSNPVTIPAGQVNSYGTVTGATTAKLATEITKEKYEALKQANKIYIRSTLNTASVSEDQFVRFEKNSHFHIKLGVKAKTKITF